MVTQRGQEAGQVLAPCDHLAHHLPPHALLLRGRGRGTFSRAPGVDVQQQVETLVAELPGLCSVTAGDDGTQHRGGELLLGDCTVLEVGQHLQEDVESFGCLRTISLDKFLEECEHLLHQGGVGVLLGELGQQLADVRPHPLLLVLGGRHQGGEGGPEDGAPRQLPEGGRQLHQRGQGGHAALPGGGRRGLVLEDGERGVQQLRALGQPELGVVGEDAAAGVGQHRHAVQRGLLAHLVLGLLGGEQTGVEELLSDSVTAKFQFFQWGILYRFSQTGKEQHTVLPFLVLI